jgi:DNA-binding NtrC family response regulator
VKLFNPVQYIVPDSGLRYTVERLIILSAGRDYDLLRLRNEVLKTRDYTVVAATTTAEVISKFHEGDFDIVLLCHTIPLEDQKAISDAVHVRNPSTPVLAVSHSGETSPYSDLLVENNPEAILRSVHIAHRLTTNFPFQRRAA